MKNCKCKKHKKDKKSDQKKKEKCNPNPYSEAVIPPCEQYLNNENILILDRDLIYRNNNKVFAFIGTSASNNSKDDLAETIDTNIEINMTTFIIGLFINQVERGIIKYDKNKPIHPDKDIDALIHQYLQNSSEASDMIKESKKSDINEQFKQSRKSESPQVKYTLSFFISNGNAIAYFVRYQINITELNYFILFTLNRLEGDPALYFANNSYATPNPANLYLAGLDIRHPIK